MQATIKLKVELPKEIVRLAYVYVREKRKMVRWLATNLVGGNLTDVLHRKFYEELKRQGVPLALALDLYRDSINTYKAWLGEVTKKLPAVKTMAVVLSPGITYSFDPDRMKLFILGREVKVLGYSEIYRGELSEARLLKKDNGWFVHIAVKFKGRKVKPKGIIAVDINEEFITAGNEEAVVQIPTRYHDAMHLIKLAEGLKVKYGKTFYHSKRIQQRYKELWKRAKNIQVDFAKKAGKWVVDVAKKLGANTIVLEDLKGLWEKLDRTQKFLLQYKRVQNWIEWQARKYGLNVIYVSPPSTPLKCPKCKGPMVDTGNRTVKCLNCGYEDNRDYVAVYNLYGRGRWALSTALGMSSPIREGY